MRIIYVLGIMVGLMAVSTAVAFNPDQLKFLTNIPSMRNPSPQCVQAVEERFTKLNLYTKPHEITVDILMYTFTDKKFMKALKELAKKKSKIRLLIDTHQSMDKTFQTEVQNLVTWSNVEVRTLGESFGESQGLSHTMHEKMVIFSTPETSYAILGSFNWTPAARTTNYENCLQITSKAKDDLEYLIQQMKDHFNALWPKSNIYEATPPSSGLASRASSQEADPGEESSFHKLPARTRSLPHVPSHH